MTSYIADLHIHSRFSRATSKASTLHGLAAWAAIKGITVVGTGDFTHPAWFAHLVEHLEPAEPGFYRLRQLPDFAKLGPLLPPGVQPDTAAIRFVLTAEISSIYKRGGRVRKVHNILFAPDFAAVRRINTTLAGIGNLESDGRPILGLDSQILLEILLEHAPDGFLVPAHIWTPWFSLFGSKSGFDTIEECFGDLSDQIFALETGLSSDPEMNRSISALDRLTFISNSDCHSPGKLGREANIFATGFDFYAMREAIREPVSPTGQQRFTATIEFYPEEGKYHCDGHRKCGVCLEPYETVDKNGLCPVCNKPLTIGVLYRVRELADRQQPLYPVGSPAVHSLIPLPELLAEMFNCGPATKKVSTVYGNLINTFGSEFTLLLDTPLADIATVSPMLSEAVRRVRENKVIRQAGFDGVFGVIRVFDEQERITFGGQLSLFGVQPAKPRLKKKKKAEFITTRPEKKRKVQHHKELNPEQQAAVASQSACILVTAGPGTGKTQTLVQRVLRLQAQAERPVTVITFTNKAVAEVRDRIADAAVTGAPAHVATLHGFCLRWLREVQSEIFLAGPAMRSRLMLLAYPQLSSRQRKEREREIAMFLATQPSYIENVPESLQPYFVLLRQHDLLDLDEVVPACISMLQNDHLLADKVRQQTGHLLIDEFQDLNASQYQLVKLLSVGCSVFAIGDPDQAIYGFRGASPVWFQHYITELHPQQHLLTTNYRNSAKILEAAGCVIDKHRESARPPAVARNKQGRLYFFKADDPVSEARAIVRHIQQLLGGTTHREIDKLQDAASLTGLALSDIAVLYRTGRQAGIIAKALERSSLPFQVLDVVAFYQTGPCKILFYWILLAAGVIDKAQLLFLCKQQKGIGPKALQAIATVVPETGDDLLTSLVDGTSTLAATVQDMATNISEIVQQIRTTAKEISVAASVDALVSLLAIDPEEIEVRRFRQLAHLSETLSTFADHLLNYQNSVVYDDRAEAVLLSTLHAAKGLEFKAVFIVGCEEGLLPLQPRETLSAEDAMVHEQEERRLFFVGMTRASEQLFLSYAASRHGGAGSEIRSVSPFIRDIPSTLLVNAKVHSSERKKSQKVRQLRLF